MIFIYPDLRQVKERTHDTGFERSTKGTLIVVLPMNRFTVQKHGVVVQYWPPGVYQVGSHKDQIGIQLIHTTSQDAIKEKKKKKHPNLHAKENEKFLFTQFSSSACKQTSTRCTHLHVQLHRLEHESSQVRVLQQWQGAKRPSTLTL